jgi:hypothetical protein
MIHFVVKRDDTNGVIFQSPDIMLSIYLFLRNHYANDTFLFENIKNKQWNGINI